MDADMAAADAWLAEDKTLDGPCPSWGNSYGRDYTKRWGVLDSLGIQRGEFCIACDRALLKPSICVLFVKRLVYRTDVVPADECEPNPFEAASLNLPPMVCGSHAHTWEHNRAWIAREGFKELPFRLPTPKIRTLEQALAATAEAVNVFLSPDQRDCRLPEGVLI